MTNLTKEYTVYFKVKDKSTIIRMYTHIQAIDEIQAREKAINKYKKMQINGVVYEITHVEESE